MAARSNARVSRWIVGAAESAVTSRSILVDWQARRLADWARWAASRSPERELLESTTPPAIAIRSQRFDLTMEMITRRSVSAQLAFELAGRPVHQFAWARYGASEFTTQRLVIDTVEVPVTSASVPNPDPSKSL